MKYNVAQYYRHSNEFPIVYCIQQRRYLCIVDFPVNLCQQFRTKLFYFRTKLLIDNIRQIIFIVENSRSWGKSWLHYIYFFNINHGRISADKVWWTSVTFSKVNISIIKRIKNNNHFSQKRYRIKRCTLVRINKLLSCLL